MQLRVYEPACDHERAAAILRELLRRGPVPYTLHPGGWEWWTLHGDHRYETVHLIGRDALAEVGIDQRYVAAFGMTAPEIVALARRYVPEGPLSVADVSVRDAVRCAELRELGFAPVADPSPVFERTTDGDVVGATLPDRFVQRALTGTAEGPSRAAAARRAFENTMDAKEHTARYVAFMRSHAYDGERDLVAIAPDGRVAGFTIYWPDTELSLAELEPVGVDPDFQRLGIARALIAIALERLRDAGIRRARVTTNGSNAAAIVCYLACGFEITDHIAWWHRP